MSVDQMLACSDASDSEAEAGLPNSDNLVPDHWSYIQSST